MVHRCAHHLAQSLEQPGLLGHGGDQILLQHLMAARKDRIWSLIEQGAIVYVCGDGGKMEPEVKAALVAIYRERSGADAEAGLRWIEELGTGNRYVLDVWASG